MTKGFHGLRQSWHASGKDQKAISTVTYLSSSSPCKHILFRMNITISVQVAGSMVVVEEGMNLKRRVHLDVSDPSPGTWIKEGVIADQLSGILGEVWDFSWNIHSCLIIFFFSFQFFSLLIHLPLWFPRDTRQLKLSVCYHTSLSHAFLLVFVPQPSHSLIIGCSLPVLTK